MKRSSLFIGFLILFALTFHPGCVKEYSFEGADVPDTLSDTSHVDTIPASKVFFPPCNLCNPNEEISLGKWSFRYDTFYLCGNITKAVITPDKTAFTFFGPSACSLDTGIVLTINVGDTLNRDRTDLRARITIFEYYDNVSQKDIFISDVPRSFSLVIDQYDHQTGIATGRFFGNATAKDHSQAKIYDGNYVIQLK